MTAVVRTQRGNLLLVRDGVWYPALGSLATPGAAGVARMLNRKAKTDRPGGFSPSDPDPDFTLAKEGAAWIGGEVVTNQAPGEEGEAQPDGTPVVF